MELTYLAVIDMAQSFLKQDLPFFRTCAAWELHCGNASARQERGGRAALMGKEDYRTPPCDQHLITARTLIAEATKLIFTTLPLISLAREQILHCSDWRHPSGADVLLSGEFWPWRTEAGSYCARCKGLILSDRDLNEMHKLCSAAEDALWQKVRGNTSESSKRTVLTPLAEELWQTREDHPP